MQIIQTIARGPIKVLGFCAALTVIFLLTGCENMKTYSVRSYQGPIPMDDEMYVKDWR